MADLEVLRRDLLAQRVRGDIGKRVHCTPDYFAFLEDTIMSAPKSVILAQQSRDCPTNYEKEFSSFRTKLIGDGIVEPNDATASQPLRFVNVLTRKIVDRQKDVVYPEGFRGEEYRGNPAVLASHDSNAFPIAVSSMPWRSGDALLAISTFPATGVSAASDQAAALVRARVLRGVSIGFVPIKYELSKDPARPLGVNFLEWSLLEWSYCSIPANPACGVIGVASDRPAPTPAAAPAPPPKSDDRAREQRIAEAAAIKRVADWRTRA